LKEKVMSYFISDIIFVLGEGSGLSNEMISVKSQTNQEFEQDY